MRIVERADNPPSKCAVSGFSDGPFVDTDARLGAVDPHIYINVDVLKSMGRLCGMVDGEEAAELRVQIAHLEDTLEQLAGELDDAKAFVQSIDIIESADFRARRKLGRKPREAVG